MARKPRQTRTDYLQALWDACTDLMEASIEFRPFRAWYVQPYGDSVRHWGDEGEELGANWTEAERTIRWLTRVELKV